MWETKGETMGKKPNANPHQIAQAQRDGVDIAFLLCMTILYDKFGFDNDQIVQFWKYAQDLSQEVVDGRVKFKDLLQVLQDEYGVMRECKIGRDYK